ncbi:MAG: hypothetical protein KAW45_02250 [Thermoplasmatales archaeon]|nr:hypothetical protein [Thermoplasmatales archaeon]
MRIEKNDIEEFFKLHKSLLLYVNNKKNLIKGVSTIPELQEVPLKKIGELRTITVNDPALVDSFIKENPFKFTNEELKTVESWKKGIFDTFFIVNYADDETFFYHPETKKCYGVLSLNDQLEEMLGSYIPRVVKTWLIPFKDRIIYDGFISPCNIVLGENMSKNIQAEYTEAIVKHRVLTSFNSREEKSCSDEELLKFYMKSETNRDRFWEEIETLRVKNLQLKALFHQEHGRVLSRKIKTKLKEIGATGHFAVIDNIVVASAPTKKELDTRITEIIPEEKKEWVHQFKIQS